MADHARRLRAQQLGRVGVLLLRHDRGARAPRVGQLAEAELRARPQHELGAEPGEVGRARRRGGEVVEHEVAPGDRVDRVRRDLREAELVGEHAPVGVEVHARPARPSRAAASRPARRRRRSARGRARASRSTRADDGRGRRAGRAADACSRASASRRAPRRARAAPPSARRSPLARARSARACTSARSVTTWSLRERAVCRRPPTGPASSVRRRSIAMWMSSSSAANAKRASRSSRSTASSPASSASRSPAEMIPRAASIARARATARRPAATGAGRSRSTRSGAGSRRAGARGSATRRPVYGRRWRPPPGQAAQAPALRDASPSAHALRVAITRAPPSGAKDTELRVDALASGRAPGAARARARTAVDHALHLQLRERTRRRSGARRRRRGSTCTSCRLVEEALGMELAAARGRRRRDGASDATHGATIVSGGRRVVDRTRIGSASRRITAARPGTGAASP